MPKMNGPLIRALLQREAMNRDGLADFAKVSLGVVDKALASKSVNSTSHERMASALKVPTSAFLLSENFTIRNLEQDSTGTYQIRPRGRKAHSTPVPSGSRDLGIEQEALSLCDNCRIPLTTIAARYHRTKNPALFSLPPYIPVICPSGYRPKKPVDLRILDTRIRWTPLPPSHATDYGNIVAIKAQTSSRRTLRDDFLYRLLTIDKHFTFCPGRYFSFINCLECLSCELSKAIIEGGYRSKICGKHVILPDDDTCTEVTEYLLSHESSVPLRQRVVPLDFGARHTPFGTATLLIVRRSRDVPMMLLNTRSSRLLETKGLMHVIPAGTFQPNGGTDHLHKDEFSLVENVCREFCEEILCSKRLRSQGAAVSSIRDMYLAKGNRLRDYIRDQRVAEVLYLGTVVDPLNLKPEAATVLMLHAGYLEALTRKFKPTWESKGFHWYDFSRDALSRLISDAPLVPTGKALLWLTLKHFDALSERLREL